MHCPFCQVNQQKNRIIHEGNHSFAILSNPRLLPGHTLVIPKRHVEKPWELTTLELQEIFETTWHIETKMLEAGLATGCDIRQNYRPFLPQGRIKVDHIHFHVLPRTNEDELYHRALRFERELFADLSSAEREHMAKLLTP
jgi:diadenosine tetraphosphate (Ap4A) HIT family hydrolase